MTSTNINDLPIEVISFVFSHICFEELVVHVRDVCYRWRIIVDNDSALWKVVTFTPKSEMIESDLNLLLSKAHMLRNVTVKGNVSVKQIVNALVMFGHNIRKLEFSSAITLTSENLKVILNKLKNLESIAFESKYIDKECIQLLGNCRSLKCVTLIGDILRLTNLLDGFASGACSLQELHLESSQSLSCENDDLLRLLAVQKDSLRSLSVSCRKVDSSLLDHIRHCSRLRKLSIKWSEIQEATDITGIVALNLSAVTLINFCGCAQMLLDAVMKSCWHTMSKLCLIFCRECNSQVVDVIISTFPLLTELKLEGSYCLTDRGLERVGQLRRLTILDVSKCPLLTDEAVRHVSSCVWLQHIALRGLSITDEGIMHLASCRNLQVVDLNECDELTGSTFIPLVGSLHKLKLLSTYRCESVEHDYMLQVATVASGICLTRLSVVCTAWGNYTFVFVKLLGDLFLCCLAGPYPAVERHLAVIPHHLLMTIQGYHFPD